MAKAIVIGLNGAEQTALSKIEKGVLPVGDHPFDALIHIKGMVRQGEASQYIPTTSIPIKMALALFVRYCGVTRDAALAALVQAMREALATGEKGADTIAEVALLDEAEAKVVAAIGQLPKKTRSGQVTLVGDLIVEKVNAQLIPLAVR